MPNDTRAQHVPSPPAAPPASSTMPLPRGEPLIEFTCRGRQSEIRPALARLRGCLERHSAGNLEDVIDSVEIALAEVLNNIVEHAGPSGRRTAIRISVCGTNAGLAIRVSDDGRPMPGLLLPDGTGPDLAVPLADLPEGGFGWGIVHALTCALHYRRAHGRNELALCFACQGADGA
ncbi:ATP-binding protein [Rhodosalinus halophilus]|uniref:ATP-binding protein n=2 Tax=Rhodosalinus halophilus TaxID=2259333 RepID=A0A365UAP5_9RHOB|nr:ATP-binding protein [Rhodosalinus halophilus]